MATVPVEITWTTGQVVTAAQLNSNLRDGINFVIARPSAELLQQVAQSIANNTVTAITFDTELLDTDNGHSTSTNTSRYTAVTAGRFSREGGVSFASNATGKRQSFWRVNGTTVSGTNIQLPALSGDTSGIPARPGTSFLNVNDFVELGVVQTSGGALNTAVTGAEMATASIRWVGTT